jgi:hypothetical protein
VYMCRPLGRLDSIHRYVLQRYSLQHPVPILLLLPVYN